MTPPRIALVGTDTAVGKTTVACALVEQAIASGIAALPFKPAQSGDATPGDAERLLAALHRDRKVAIDVRSRLLALDVDAICPLRYAPPLAPGIADDATRFVGAPRIDPAPLERCRAALALAIASTEPDLVLIELAGGLWVPMPGGSWQPQWLRELADHTIVVGRAGLGAINAALLTIDALRELGRAPLGFVLCETAAPDPSNRHNATVIARARALPHLGTIPYDGAPPQLLAPLLAALHG